MSATLSHPTRPPVRDGAICVACQAPLGAATRYCLSCGARQAAARTELLDLVVPRAGAAVSADAAPAAPTTAVFPAAAPPPVAPPVLPASVASLAAAGPRTWPFAVTAAVLVALVVGLVAGRLLADGRDASSGPQVIRIEGAGGAVAPSTQAPAAEAPPEGVPASGAASAPAPAASGAVE